MSDAVRSYRDLDVWRLAMELVEGVFKVTSGFPREQRFALSAQIQRSAISIPSNIADGAGRSGRLEFRRFVHIALGSTNELRTQLEIAQRLGFDGGIQKLLLKSDRVGSVLMGSSRALSPARATG